MGITAHTNRRVRLGTKAKNTKPQSPYSKIDWEKVAVLFARTKPKEMSEGKFPDAKELLSFLAVAGAVGLVFAFPPAITGVAALVQLGKRSYQPWGVRRALERFARQKYVTIKEHGDGRTTVTITKHGMTRALTYELNALQLNKPKRWDRKWRVVIFDIPEKYKDLRDLFRMRLCQLGLFQLQESVYVSPYPCFDEVEFLRELYGISFTVRYLLVERVEDDASLRTHFHLS